MPANETRMDEVRAVVKEFGVDYAADKFNLKRETVRRYTRRNKAYNEEPSSSDVVSQSDILVKIGDMYSDKELRAIASGGMAFDYKHNPVHDFDGKNVKIGYITDTHIGSKYTDTSYIIDAREEFAKAGVDMIVHSGDVTEGMSNRAGHVYECTEIGYDAQRSKAVELLNKFDFCPMYVIDGNHDRWFAKTNGALIVKDICAAVDSCTFIGHDEGDIQIGENASVKLWHGEDGSSYAHSYRIQKLIESWQGGTKPNILFTGHVHKYGHFFERNIHCISSGCIQKQSKWMRGKRLPAHTGFGIVEATVNDKGIGKLSNTFFPFYS